ADGLGEKGLEPPAAEVLGDGQDELVVALLEREIDGVALRVQQPEKFGLPERERVVAGKDGNAVQEHDDLVAVAELQLPDAVPVGPDPRAGQDELPSGAPALDALFSIGRQDVWAAAIPVDHDHPGILGFNLRPLQASEFGKDRWVPLFRVEDLREL